MESLLLKLRNSVQQAGHERWIDGWPPLVDVGVTAIGRGDLDGKEWMTTIAGTPRIQHAKTS